MFFVDMLTDLQASKASDPGRKLRILLSAYACLPAHGSEPGIGWDWATRLARAGHDVWVLTLAFNREGIERALAAQPPANLHFVYYDLPVRSRSWMSVPERWMRLHYLLWQCGAYWVARGLCRQNRFDVIHHLTYGVFRHPSFLAFLGVPFVFGPVGGGETAPHPLRRTFPLRGYLLDLVRDIANRTVSVDPLMDAVFRRSALTLCKTNETLLRVPARFRGKCRLQVELGTDEAPTPVRAAQDREGAFRVLYVGRLVYWKGLHLGLMAFAKLLEMHPTASMTVIGSGPDEAWLRNIARRHGLDGAVQWLPRMEQAKVMQAYLRHDAFLFPSLHDSSGNVVLEALSRALPVVCVGVGGPAVLVDASCGFRVPPGEPRQVVDALARSLAALAEDGGLAQSMGRAAVRRAQRHFSWANQISRMERLYSLACGVPQGIADPAE
jgi:glycosyltransferase involved in cell wall biosynthesis